MTKDINYVGWIGHHNLGDEALFYAIQKLFNQYQLVTTQGKASSHITFFGGGTLIPVSCISSKPPNRPNKYNYVFGTAVRDQEFFGKWNPTIIDRVKCFNFRRVGVRDPFSKRTLHNWGIDAEVIGDPCLSLKPNPKQVRYENRIAVNLGSDGLVWGGNEEKVFQEILKVCNKLQNEGYEPVIIPFNKDDYVKVKSTDLSKFSVFEDWSSFEKVLDFIASSKVLIGERLHSNVFSSCALTPFISLEYRPKCYHFAESVGFEKYVIRTSNLTSDKVLNNFYTIMDNWLELHLKLEKSVSLYRNKQIEFAESVVSDIESLPDSKWSPSDTSYFKDTAWLLDGFLNSKSRSLWPVWNKYIFHQMLKH